MGEHKTFTEEVTKFPQEFFNLPPDAYQARVALVSGKLKSIAEAAKSDPDARAAYNDYLKVLKKMRETKVN